jgi:hypothetical protein
VIRFGEGSVSELDSVVRTDIQHHSILIFAGWLLKFLYARHLELDQDPFNKSRAPRIGPMTPSSDKTPGIKEQPGTPSTLTPVQTLTRLAELASPTKREQPPPYDPRHKDSRDSLQEDLDKHFMRWKDV